MALYLASLNSGSNANCYYVGNKQEGILIDVGLSLRETEKRMTQIGLSIEKVKAIFISHEHSDHITGLPAISKKYQLPVFINQKTLLQCNVPIEEHLVADMETGKSISINELQIIPFAKHHDAAEPVSFTITYKGTVVGVMTDIGHACKEVVAHFKKCHAVFLESNYCDVMLDKGNYPYYLKQRICGDMGHLSNAQALELFCMHRSEHLRLLILSHLSKNNNHPEVVEKLFKPFAGNTQVVVASRYSASSVFEINQFTSSGNTLQPQLTLF
jgi:phosphoribosyl 1,2-cyclic phosphodiesterase